MTRRLHRAGWVMVRPGVWIEGGLVEVVDGRVLSGRLHRRLPVAVGAKDLALPVLAIRADAGVGRVAESGGSGVRALDIDERATLTNMCAELGGFTGIVEPDDITVRFLRERRCTRADIASDGRCRFFGRRRANAALMGDCARATRRAARGGYFVQLQLPDRENLDGHPQDHRRSEERRVGKEC